MVYRGGKIQLELGEETCSWCPCICATYHRDQSFLFLMVSLLLARRLVDGTATHADLMCNMVWYKVLRGDARMEGYMEVRKLFFFRKTLLLAWTEVDNTAGQAADFVFRILFDKRILVNEENGWVCQKGRDPG